MAYHFQPRRKLRRAQQMRIVSIGVFLILVYKWSGGINFRNKANSVLESRESENCEILVTAPLILDEGERGSDVYMTGLLRSISEIQCETTLIIPKASSFEFGKLTLPGVNIVTPLPSEADTFLRMLLTMKKFRAAFLNLFAWFDYLQELDALSLLLKQSNIPVIAVSYDFMRDRVGGHPSCNSSCVEQYEALDVHFWEGADFVAAVSGSLSSRIRERSKKPVATIRHSVPVGPPHASWEASRDIVYVGSNNPSNIKTVQWFIDHLGNFLKRNKITLRVYGSCVNAFQHRRAPRSIIFAGNIKAEDLDHQLRFARVFLAPIFENTGVSTKVLLALASGTPVITTAYGFDGLHELAKSYAIEQGVLLGLPVILTPSVLIQHLNTTYFDKRSWSAMSEGSQKLIAEYHSRGAQVEDVRAIIESLPITPQGRQKLDRMTIVWESRGCPSYDVVSERLGRAVSKQPGVRFLRAPSKVSADVFISIVWPPTFTRPRTCPRGKCTFIAYPPWEIGQIPKYWQLPLLTNADLIFAESKFHAEMFLQAGIPGQMIVVVPHGVTCFPKSTSRALLRASLSVPSDAVVFLYVGTLVPRKGVDILERTWLALSVTYPSGYLIVKTGMDDSPLFERLRLLSKIPSRRLKLITDSVDDAFLMSLYDASDVLVHPARAEGFGLTIAEGLSRGLVIIAATPGASDDFLASDYAIVLPGRKKNCEMLPCLNNSYCVFPDMSTTNDRWGGIWNHCQPLIGTPFWHEINDADLLSAMVSLLDASVLAAWKQRALLGQRTFCNNFNSDSLGAFLVTLLRERTRSL